jgi:protein subunit release factor B
MPSPAPEPLSPRPLTVWLVNPFDDVPGEGAPPLRTWTLARVLAARGHDVTWWTATWSHRRKAIRTAPLGIREDEIVEKFIHGSGSGGQKINKTASCVYLKHEPTGIEIKCQRERSRELNRYLARKELCDRIDEIKNGVESKRQQAMEKIRR